jgi:hypothetical protein
MGLLDGITHKQYYQGHDHGNYQFTSLNDIIDQFMMVYVGENKIIPKTKRLDVAFHAMRALQELSFDTFKSCKSQQIDIPPSLKMTLPHDYVNYTKVSWVDSAGIKHPLYPTSDTSNPFQIAQEDDGSYSFPEEAEEVVDGDFAAGNFDAWVKSPNVSWSLETRVKSEISNNKLQFSHGTRNGNGATAWGYTSVVYQELDVSDKTLVNLSASGIAANHTNGDIGVLRVGLSTNIPDSNNMNFLSSSLQGYNRTANYQTSIFNLFTSDGDNAYIEWTVSDNTTDKEILAVDVSSSPTVYLIVVSYHESYDPTASIQAAEETNSIDNISVTNSLESNFLSAASGNEENSSTWNNYKSTTPSENNNDDYEDDTYWPINGKRYGLDPKHAQVNGSFYIDCRLGKIHFSSNISGKTVILDYISDSLGTDEEMQVHKFAEEAMYKYIIHAILSTSSYGQSLVPRLTKEKFSAIRKAKLRLSNIKLEEITQIFRGKSKQIKH